MVQRAMRHSSTETKRRYQWGMADEVRKAVEKANTRLYGRRPALHFRDSRAEAEKVSSSTIAN